MRDETMTARMVTAMHKPAGHHHSRTITEHSHARTPKGYVVGTQRRQSHEPTVNRRSPKASTKTRTIDDLPNEILTKIFAESTDVRSALNFAATCKHLTSVWASCRRVEILQNAAAAEYAPFDEAVQLVTFNRSEPAWIRRSPPVSMALIKQVVKVGNTANMWLDKYPQLRWDNAEAANRRLLTRDESERFRRALYRSWLYSNAFHTTEHTQSLMYSNNIRAGTMDRRLIFIRHYTVDEIIEMGEVHELIHNFVLAEICPSNSKIQTHYNILNPDSDPIYFGSYSTYPNAQSMIPNRPRDLASNMAAESWGSDPVARGSAAGVMKLNPAELLWVHETLPRKSDRKAYFNSLEGFTYQPATFRAALETVMVERGESCLAEIVDYEGWAGILDHGGIRGEDDVEEDGGSVL